MRLRLRLTLVLLAVNLVVLGALAWWTANDEVERTLRNESYKRLVAERLGTRLAERFESGETNDLADILAWPGWQDFEDVLLIDSRVLGVGEELVPVGAFLSPNGSRHRAANFPMRDVMRAMVEASESLEPILVANGICLPLIIREKFSRQPRTIWGGVYLVDSDTLSLVSVPTLVLAAAVAASLLSAGLVYLFLGRSVLRPIERLAAEAERFEHARDVSLPAKTGAREIDGLVHAFGSMTERIQNFREELELEVERATDTAADAERRAARQDRLAAMGTLAAGLAHEINSPLAGALHGLETLRREASSDRARKHGELTEDALQRIRVLVQRLLQLAPTRVEQGECVLQEVIHDVHLFLEGRLEGIDFQRSLPAEELRLAVAPGDLFPVLLNLVQNACDALAESDSAEPPCIEIQALAQVERSRVVITVLDNGPGVSAELLPHLFEPFVTTKDVGAGTGLGLAVAHATVRQFGGRMEANRRTEGGFAVSLDLPWLPNASSPAAEV